MVFAENVGGMKSANIENYSKSDKPLAFFSYIAGDLEITRKTSAWRENYMNHLNKKYMSLLNADKK